MSGLVLATDGFTSFTFLASFLACDTDTVSSTGFCGGSLGESAMERLGASNCLLTATDVCGAVTVLKVAEDDLEDDLENNDNCDLAGLD